MAFLVENSDSSPILGKNSIYGSKFPKGPILGENHENIPLWVKMPLLSENPENTPYWAKMTRFGAIISKITHFWRKYLILAENGPS